MKINKLYLLNYRNYEEVSLDFDKNKTIIVGKNATGKTNLLEAVYFLSNLSSFRTFSDNELVMFDKDFARIKGDILKNETDISLEVWINPGKRKVIKINDIKKTKFVEFKEVLSTVKFTSSDLLIMRGGKKERREWLDEAICQIYPSYSERLQKYTRIKDQKNNLLKKYKQFNIQNTEVLDILNEQLSTTGSNIIFIRKKYISEIKENVKKFHSKMSEGTENLDINYSSNILDEENLSVEQIAENFKNKLEEHKEDEINSAKTLVGPHRDDIEFFINDKNCLNYSSLGQQRTVILALKLAEIEFIKEKKQEIPILLLDDVLAELDKERQNFLLSAIDENMQTIITTTDINNFDKNFLEGVEVISTEKIFE